MKSAEMRTIVDRYIDAYNRMDIPAMLLTVHPDVMFKSISGGSVNAGANGIAELRALAEQSLPQGDFRDWNAIRAWTRDPVWAKLTR